MATPQAVCAPEVLHVSPRALYAALKALGTLPRQHVVQVEYETKNGKTKVVRYLYAPVRVTDGEMEIAVAFDQLKTLARKSPASLSVIVDQDGMTLDYESGSMHLCHLGEYSDVPLVDLRSVDGY